ncbi:MAG: DinB family protein [Deltaproteobacteria bacterium]|nr:DinB family protein [Deltaproteobacteria bacterium]
MVADLKIRYDALEAKRQSIFTLLYGLNADQTTFRDGPSRWSILMVLEHAVIAEEMVLADIRRADTEGTAPKSPEAFHMVIKAFEKDIPVEVPLPELEPTGGVLLDELIVRWEAARTGLRQALMKIPLETLRAPICHHPVAGPMDARETLEFLAGHLDHHLRQIRRIGETIARTRI